MKVSKLHRSCGLSFGLQERTVAVLSLSLMDLDGWCFSHPGQCHEGKCWLSTSLHTPAPLWLRDYPSAGDYKWLIFRLYEM